MSEGRSRCSLGDLFEIENGFAFKSADFQAAGVPVIKIKNIKANHFAEGEHSFVSSRFTKKRPNKVARRGDLLISMSGNRHDGSPETWVGKVAPFNHVGTFLINQRVGALRPKPHAALSTRYFGYLLSSWSFQEHFIAVATSSGGQANLSPSQILAVPVEYPTLPEQRAIAATLGALDDKIALNRRMNETLEGLARALFKDWFVDFGPTRAKASGTKPYLPPEIRPLFPDRPDDKGVPDGWEVSEIGKEAKVVGGSTPSTKEPRFWGGGIHWTTPKDLSALKSPVLFETNRTITEAGLERISSGLLPVRTVLLSSRAPIGYIAIAAVPVAVNQGYIALRCEGRLSNVYVWLWLHENMEAIKGNANGSTFQEISKKNFRPLPVVVPSEGIMDAFNKMVLPLYERIEKNELESRTLAQTRDLLLPKLMSGALRVGAAEKIVAGVL